MKGDKSVGNDLTDARGQPQARAVPLVPRRFASIVCALIFAQNAIALCAGWQATPEARRQCCRDGACPLHHSEDSTPSTQITQTAADDCCAQSQRQESSPSATAFASTLTLAVLAPVPTLALSPVNATPAAVPWET